VDSYKLIITGSRDRSIRIWDDITLELLKEISMTKYKAHTHSVNYLLWMEKEKVLLSASDDKTVKSWIITKI
jgi:WD40 repeat protein